MIRPEQAALIISVYKNTTDLEVVLRSVENQSITGSGVIISEDGESEEMKTFVENYRGNLSIQHVTQQDIGWRKNAALNNAIRNSKQPYLVFIDGDCVLHPKFIEEHLQRSNENQILAGRRVKLGPKFSTRLRRDGSVNRITSRFVQQIPLHMIDGASFIEEGVYSKAMARLKQSKTLKGCNFSCYRSALQAINGFDENYELPAVGEDTDLDWRFEGLGFEIKSVRHLAVQYHLHHKEGWQDVRENLAYMKEKMGRQEFVAKNGLT